MEKNTQATAIHNLIILDESGSMSCVHNQTIAGCNEIINGLIDTQRKNGDVQRNYLSIYAFQSGSRPSHYIVKNIPAQAAEHITAKDYQPWGNTPLYDALGMTINELKHKLAGTDDIASVTVITDGWENASTEYSQRQVVKLINELKEKGWNFNFIGANIDAEQTAKSLAIDNHLQFEQTGEGTTEMFSEFSYSRACYADSMADMDRAEPCATMEEKLGYRKSKAKGFFK